MENRDCCRKHWEQDSGKHATTMATVSVLINPMGMPFITCGKCGNKRCPKATDCGLDCTGSNKPGQAGSIYG